MAKRLSRKFFTRDAKTVAEEIIGCSMVMRRRGKKIRLQITEAEAYVGPHDLACHTARGRTERTEVMFGSGGYAYVYLIYGMYWMFNIVTGKCGDGEAVLIRGARGDAVEFSGPGKFTKAIGINKSWNGRDLCGSEIYFEPRLNKTRILRTPRIGVDYAGAWAKKKLRFVIKN